MFVHFYFIGIEKLLQIIVNFLTIIFYFEFRLAPIRYFCNILLLLLVFEECFKPIVYQKNGSYVILMSNASSNRLVDSQYSEVSIPLLPINHSLLIFSKIKIHSRCQFSHVVYFQRYLTRVSIYVRHSNHKDSSRLIIVKVDSFYQPASSGQKEHSSSFTCFLILLFY